MSVTTPWLLIITHLSLSTLKHTSWTRTRTHNLIPSHMFIHAHPFTWHENIHVQSEKTLTLIHIYTIAYMQTYIHTCKHTYGHINI